MSAGATGHRSSMAGRVVTSSYSENKAFLNRGLYVPRRHRRRTVRFGPSGLMSAAVSTLVSTTMRGVMRKWWHICHQMERLTMRCACDQFSTISRVFRCVPLLHEKWLQVGYELFPISGSRHVAPSNPHWSVTASRRLRRPVPASPLPITAGETPVFLGEAAGPLRAG